MNIRLGHQEGFTTWELLIVVVIVIFLFSAAVFRLLPLRGDAEKVHVLQVVGNLRSALGMEVARRVIREPSRIGALENENPMSWLKAAPSYTSGDECFVAAPGEWRWCESSNLLVYRLRYQEYFKATESHSGYLRFRTVVERDDDLIKEVRIDALDGLPVLTEDSHERVE